MPILAILLATAACGGCATQVAQAADAAPDGARHRVLVSTDIGGTDPDDFQSMVHLLVYADLFEIEGLVASPYGPGRKQDLLRVIDAYEQDYPCLARHSERYPTADTLRAVCKQGATELPGASGLGEPTEGSRWIIESARRDDPRPLHVLVWGGLEDLAQALHDAPDILPKLRVYFIGGPNKKWSVNAYNYIEQRHPELWMIEANATYRGWFTGGDQQGEWDNRRFVASHVAGHGALGALFVDAKDDLKMGDTPSVARLLHGVPDDPAAPGWGGSYVRIWDGRKTVFHGLPTRDAQSEAFGVTEFVLHTPDGYLPEHHTQMTFSGGRPPSPGVVEEGGLRFRFSPRDAKVWDVKVQSDHAALDGLTAQFEATPASAARTRSVSTRHPNWWIDDPDPAQAVGVHPGAKSVSRWRKDFLADFAERMDRCRP
ncbi:DUF1593 domain-containing protein [Posidoniimonas corsicana]|nr:DUF1593 domain-containing protein [Posidoniimonas corsicana]